MCELAVLQVNASGKNVMKALLSVVTAIHQVNEALDPVGQQPGVGDRPFLTACVPAQVDLNLVYDKEEGGCEKYCKKCTIM